MTDNHFQTREEAISSVYLLAESHRTLDYFYKRTIEHVQQMLITNKNLDEFALNHLKEILQLGKQISDEQ